MRTTLNLDDEILRAARALARAEHRSVGEVISELARRGLTPRSDRSAEEEDGFPVFRVPEDAPVITAEMVQAALDEP
ncbi:MAG TPA: hypothetical protein VFA11_15490 [Acidimicrobiales bacterium]|nr:hypothetical protein [Acidimicrobiales bacterium]